MSTKRNKKRITRQIRVEEKVRQALKQEAKEQKTTISKLASEFIKSHINMLE